MTESLDVTSKSRKEFNCTHC